jgi:hypothetical protein
MRLFGPLPVALAWLSEADLRRLLPVCCPRECTKALDEAVHLHEQKGNVVAASGQRRRQLPRRRVAPRRTKRRGYMCPQGEDDVGSGVDVAVRDRLALRLVGEVARDGVQEAEADRPCAAMLVPRESALEWMPQNGDLSKTARATSASASNCSAGVSTTPASSARSRVGARYRTHRRGKRG